MFRTRRLPPAALIRSNIKSYCRSRILQKNFSVNETRLKEKEHIAPKYIGPNYDRIVEIKNKNLTPNIKSFYKKPLLIHHGHMQWLYDDTGKKYLDMFAGIVTVTVGHCHPKVNSALNSQLNQLWHTTNIYMHPKIHEYAERLVAKMPGNLNVVYFVNSGSEANDLAMFLARMSTGSFDIITLQNSFHGMSPYSMGLTAHSPWKFNLPGANNGIHHAMLPDPYKGIWGGKNCRDSPIQTDRKCSCSIDYCSATDEYLTQLQTIFDYSIPIRKCAGMFAESIQGVGGTVQFTKDYVKRAAELVRKNGGVFISDEVQTGFGRTGDHFWGFESHGIIPDIVTLAKGIGNGFPLGAVVTTPDIAKCLTQALHFNTFGGNPLASAVGLSVLDVIEEEELQINALEVGTYMLNGLSQLKDNYKVIGDVRGKGLMIGVELVEDQVSNSPLSANRVADIWERCKDLGVLLGKGGLHGNVFRIKPPMCITKKDVDMTLNVLETALKTS